ncbi:MAG: serine acetyltransferase [Bacteroidales bacterium]|nr:serine acetyltransferase [Bacteroidales bacterium]
MQEVIKADLYRYVPQPYGIFKLLKGFRSQGFRYMFYRRKLRLCRRMNPLRFFYWALLRHYMYKYGFQIGGNIGGGLFIGHFGTIVTGADVIIGNNCNIAHGVTIGVTRRGSKPGTPIIGNEVWIGTGAVIVGGISIGNNVLIAPNAYVNFDVPDNSIVIGNPGSIIPSLNATKDYINNKYRS